MSRQKEKRCPGCSRHCTEENVRCKYGRSYFEKRKAAVQDEESRMKYKWEKYVEAGGTVWQLLRLGTEVKKALKDGEATDTQIADRLSEEERKMLAALLDKMREAIIRSNQDV